MTAALRPLATAALRAAGLDAGVELAWPDDVTASGVAHDSRTVVAGDVFCCWRGEHSDGHDFAAAAVARGAVALVVDRPTHSGAPELVVPDVRAFMPHLAAEFWGHPSRDLAVVGVTGTNGKTTTCHLVAEIARAGGRRAEVIGTLSGARTTPESTELQRVLAHYRDGGAAVVAMEVSSHALDQHRVDAVRFRVGAFTNLTPDHLDYHHSMEAYFEAKAQLFDPSRIDLAVVHVGTDPGQRILDRATRLGVHAVAVDLEAADPIVVTPSGSSFRWRDRRVEIPLGGRFNVSNALVAAEICVGLGIDESVIESGLAGAHAVPGRFELVDAGQPFAVVVDYAHTPDGLAKLLAAARELTDGRIIVVFGCGGDRDTAKRPLMGAAADTGADIVIVTSDNPRSEDPDVIIEQILGGIRPKRAITEADRRTAIELAVRTAVAGDVVVIAGKGHETTQEIGGRLFAFSDVAVAIGLLEGIDESGGQGGRS